MSWYRYIRTAKMPELPVVLLEDAGALVGLVIALTGITLAVTTGVEAFDGIASLLIGVLLVVIAAVLASEMRSLLIGESPAPETQDRIRAAISAGPEVRGVIHMRSIHVGPDELLVAAKVEFDPSLTVAGLAAAVDAAEARLRREVPIARMVYLEPDLDRGGAGGRTPPAGGG